VKILRFFDFTRWRPPPSWIFKFVKCYWLTVSEGHKHITVPSFVKIGRSVVEILRFFVFLKWPPPPSWIFETAKFYWLLGSRGSRRICMPNFVKICQSVAKILRFFDFSRWRPAILYFQICEILLADGVWRSKTHNCAKFRHNRRSIAEILRIFEIFQMAAAAILDFWNREIYWLLGSRGLRRIFIPNFVKIGQSVAKILRFFDFLRWRPPPYWIFKFVKCYWLTVSSQSVVLLQRYCDFSNFQDGRRRHLRFFKSRILLVIRVQRVETHLHAKFCQNQSIGCEDIKIFWFFKMAAAAILDSFGAQLDHPQWVCHYHSVKFGYDR